MPIHLPPKARDKAVLARRQAAAPSIDWLGLWALSVAFCAIILAGIAYFMIRDNIGASFILVGAAATLPSSFASARSTTERMQALHPKRGAPTPSLR